MAWRATTAVVALGVSLLGVGIASAQTCEEGREATEETQGRCCWPGQSWSDVFGRCAGPPSCPASLVAAGDECVARRQPASAGREQPPPAAPADGENDAVDPSPGISRDGEAVLPTAPATSTTVDVARGASSESGQPRPVRHRAVSWPAPPAGLDRPAGGLHPSLATGADPGWVTFGSVSLVGGWLFSVLVGSVVGLAGPESCSETGGYAFVPVVGGMIHAAHFESCSTRDAGILWGTYIPSAAAQLAGTLALVLTFVLSDAEELRLDSLAVIEAGAASISPALP